MEHVMVLATPKYQKYINIVVRPTHVEQPWYTQLEGGKCQQFPAVMFYGFVGAKYKVQL